MMQRQPASIFLFLVLVAAVAWFLNQERQMLEQTVNQLATPVSVASLLPDDDVATETKEVVDASSPSAFPNDDPTVFDYIFEKLDKTNTNTCHIQDQRPEDLRKAFDDSVFVFRGIGWFHNDSRVAERRRQHLLPLPDYDQEKVWQVGINGKPEISDTKGGVAVFQNAFVHGKFPLVFDCRTVYFPGGCRFAKKNQFPISKLTDDAGGGGHPQIEYLDSAVLIVQFFGSTFYHAMVEDLLRLVQVVPFLQAHPDFAILSEPQILMKDGRHSELFNPLLGLTNDHPWVPFSPDKIYHIRRLLVPTATSCGWVNPAGLKGFQALLSKHGNATLPKKAPRTQSNKKRIILVHKRSARGLSNHHQLIEALQQRFDECCSVVPTW